MTLIAHVPIKVKCNLNLKDIYENLNSCVKNLLALILFG